MNLEVILRECSKQILRILLGQGTWETWASKRRNKPDDPLMGLSIGDKVYWADRDRSALVERSVHHVSSSGVAYVADQLWRELIPVETGEWFLSKREAVMDARDALRKDEQFHWEHFKRIQEMLEMLEDN